MIPVSLLQGNVVFDADGNPYAVYVLPSLPYAFQNTNIKISMIQRIAKSFEKYTGKLYLYLLTKQFAADQVASRMMSISKSRDWERQVSITEKYLYNKMPFERVNFVVIPLRKVAATYFDQDKIQFLKEVGINFWNGLWSIPSKIFKPILNNELTFAFSMLERVQEMADEALEHELLNFTGIRKATQREVEWWLKKGYHRGLRDPDLQLPISFPTHVSEINGENKILPIKNTLLTLSKLSKEKLEHIESYTDDGISYSSYMPILHVPSEILKADPTGQEWIYGPIERLSFPVDVAIVMNIESSDDAIKKLKRKRKITLSQIREWKSGGQDVPEEVVDELHGVDSGLQSFRQEKTPLIHMNAILGVGAPTVELLRRRKKILQDEVETYGVKTANSPGDQKMMFQNFYPFARKALFDRWTIQMEPGVLAAGMPFGIRKLGDPFGFILGNLVANDRPVYMNPERPTKELQRANTIIICGDPGSGKTTTGKHIAHNLIEMDSIGFIEDPKGDYDLFAKHPTVKKKSRVVSFVPRDEDDQDFEQVPLNIFRLAKERTQRVNAASTVINLLLNPKDDENRGFVIGEALSRLYLGQKWDMFAFTDQLQQMADQHEKTQYRDQADYCLGHLKNLNSNGIGSSLFVEDNEEMIFDRNILISITRGLVIPRSNSTKETWTIDERVSAAIRYATSTLSFRHLMSLKRSQLKFQVFEEYWILKKFPGGRQLIEEALRFSRFENMLVILSTQNPTDSLEDETTESDDINGLFSWKIMLRLESKEQIKAALTLLGMSEEDPEDWYTTFSVTYKDGKGLAKDPEGNIGEIQINPVDSESMPYFKSTPKDEEETKVNQMI